MKRWTLTARDGGTFTVYAREAELAAAIRDAECLWSTHIVRAEEA